MKGYLITFKGMIWGTLLESLRRKDIYVLLILSLVIIGGAGSMTFFSLGGMDKFLKDIGLTVINACVIVLAVMATARQIPTELENRTIYPLLAKPMSRAEFLTGKFGGALLLSLIVLILFSLEFLIAVRIIGGTVGVVFIQYVYCRFLSLMFIVALTLTLSIVVHYGANVTISLILTFCASLFSRSVTMFYHQFESSSPLTAKLIKWIYYFIPHFDLFDLSKKVVHNWEPVPSQALIYLTVYALMYSIALMIIGYFIFRRKPI